MTDKRHYAVVSGEGEGAGSWRVVVATDRGIKRILTRERCDGARWARAYYKPVGVGDVGINAETGEPQCGVFVGSRRYWE